MDDLNNQYFGMVNVSRKDRYHLLAGAVLKAFVAAFYGFGIAVLALVLNPIFFARDAYRWHTWPWDFEP